MKSLNDYGHLFYIVSVVISIVSLTSRKWIYPCEDILHSVSFLALFSVVYLFWKWNKCCTQVLLLEQFWCWQQSYGFIWKSGIIRNTVGAMWNLLILPVHFGRCWGGNIFIWSKMMQWKHLELSSVLTCFLVRQSLLPSPICCRLFSIRSLLISLTDG